MPVPIEDVIDFFSTTLTQDCGAGTGKIYVNDITNLPSTGYLVISQTLSAKREIIHYSSTGTDGTGDYVDADVRGVGVTSATTHSEGETIRMNMVAAYWAYVVTSLQLDGAQTLTGIKTFTSTAIPRLNTAGTWGAGTEEYFITKRYADALAIAGAPDGSTTQKGIFEEATQAEIDADTAAGATGARLAINPSTLVTSKYGVQLPTADEKDALAGTSGTPSSSNLFVTANDQTRNLDQVQYAASAAGSDTYAVTLSPAPTAYTAGMTVTFKADVANTGAATLNVNALGAKSIYKNVTSELATGDIAADQLVTVIYDGAAFQLGSQLSSSITSTNIYFPQTVVPVFTNYEQTTRQFVSSYLSYDGVFFSGSNHGGTLVLSRYQRDTYGQIYRTHQVTSSETLTTTYIQNYNLFQPVGDYLYVYMITGGGQKVKRFDKATLANETLMTISGGSISGGGQAIASFYDGTYFNINNNGSAGGRKNRYTLSGTTLTYVDQYDYPNYSWNGGSWCDGTYVYLTLDGGSGNIYTRRQTLSSATYTDFYNGQSSVFWSGEYYTDAGIAALSSSLFLYANCVSIADETQIRYYALNIYPMSKPS